MHENRPSYRKDIDGLRAIAVGAVILYHARIAAHGGYVGVDVFFVISGYLISKLIAGERQRGTFSLLQFWERRVCRLFPAWFFMVAVVLVVGWFAFVPSRFLTTVLSAAAQVLGVSNVFFWMTPTGYFDPSIESQPLLHTWSLAVEEQFYLLYPLLWVSQRILVCIAVASFALNVYVTQTYPEAAFYLLPMRAWELLLGGILAGSSVVARVPKWAREAAGVVGMALIAFAVVKFGRSTVFPGWAALVPCVGAALVIVSSEGTPSFVGRFLSLRPFVFAGLLSYSLYLWHWPWLAVSKYFVSDPTAPLRAAAVVASLPCAYFSWRYVETPLRSVWKRWPSHRVFGCAGAAVLGILAFALVTFKLGGIPGRFSDEALRIYESGESSIPLVKVSVAQAQRGELPALGDLSASKADTVLWGDSHAMAIVPVLDRIGKQLGRKVIQITWTGTPPILNGSWTPSEMRECSEAAFSYIKKNRIRQVLLAGNWKVYAKNPTFESELVSTVEALRAIGANVFIMESVPDQKVHITHTAAFLTNVRGKMEWLERSVEQHREDTRQSMLVFQQAAAHGAVVLDPTPFFLNEKGRLESSKAGHTLYRDGNHLNLAGAYLLEPLLLPIFKTGYRR